MSAVHLCMYVSKCMCGTLCMPVHAGAGGGCSGEQFQKAAQPARSGPSPKTHTCLSFPSWPGWVPLSLKFSWDGGETQAAGLAGHLLCFPCFSLWGCVGRFTVLVV